MIKVMQKHLNSGFLFFVSLFFGEVMLASILGHFALS